MSRLIRSYKNREGLTLLEVGIVLAVFALIIIGVLTAVSVVNASGRNSRAVSQIGNIRSAIGKWSAGGPVAAAAIKSSGGTVLVSAMGLFGWDPIRGYLPGSLQTVISQTPGTSGTLVLSNANPWQGKYEICTPANTCGVASKNLNSGTTFKYGIKVTSVNAGELPTVVNQLRTAGTGDTTLETLGTMSFVVIYSN